MMLNVLAHGANSLPVDTVQLAVWTGLLAGIAHTFLGADHLAALLPLSVNRKFKAAWLGVRWGAGHSLGVVIVAVILLAGRESLDLSPVEEWGERLVGVMLIALGLWGVRSAMRQSLHVHEHTHDADTHAHLHAHTGDAHDPADTASWHSHLHKHAAIGAGTLHGVAGMAHLLGVIPALLAPTLLVSFAYLAGFAAGSILSMGLFAGTFGAVTARLGSKSPALLNGSMYVAAVACILIGVFWIVAPFLMPEDQTVQESALAVARHPLCQEPQP
ncbi:MAG: hypothetical protein IT464_02265 [Planctomycetes bacterium]|nr:hypothetical protein [Planctomycetota bacterium]